MKSKNLLQRFVNDLKTILTGLTEFVETGERECLNRNNLY